MRDENLLKGMMGAIVVGVLGLQLLGRPGGLIGALAGAAAVAVFDRFARTRA